MVKNRPCLENSSIFELIKICFAERYHSLDAKAKANPITLEEVFVLG